MKHIDVHQHLGPCNVFDLEVTKSQLAAAIDDTPLEGCIVQPFPGAADAPLQHDAIADLARTAPFKIWGIASINPHIPDDAYRSEIRRCVQDLGFVGVKLHSIGHAVHPASKDGHKVFTVARELGIPVMVHTGDGVPFADPTAVLGPAQEFPDVSILLAHAGMSTFAGNAIAVARVCPNVYLEPSWCKTPEIGAMIDILGADRVMFGADLPFNVRPETEKFLALGLSPRDLEAVMWGTASDFFKLQ